MNRILVVEDNKNVRENIAELLNNSGYEVTQAGNGIEAIQEFKLEKPDLILCDIMMPRMDGLEFYSKIQEYELIVNIPFIFLTAKTDFRIQNKAMELGVDDYIKKPFKARELLTRIKTRITKKEKIEAKFDKLKEDISLYVPHELQTPIFPIIGYSEMILSDIDNFTKTELIEMVGSIHRSALRLKQRMEKFNKFTELRIQICDKFVNNRNDFLTKTVINRELIETLINKNWGDIKIDIEGTELSIAKNDLDNLLFELIENAYKFTSEKNKVVIRGKKLKGKYILEVQNSGKEFNINLTDDFHQHRRRKKQQIGNGLGIAIVSLIAKKYRLKIYSKNDTYNKVFVKFNI